MDILPVKFCSRCGETKPFADFRASKTSKDGLEAQCVDCRKAYYQRWYEANKQRHKANVRIWDEENHSKRLEQQRRYEAKDSAKHKKAEWRKVNSTLCCLYVHKRRIKQQVNGGTYTIEQFERLCAAYGNVCVACGKSAKLTVDHVVPVSKGGSNDMGNIQPLCGSCNSKKHDHEKDFRPFTIAL